MEAAAQLAPSGQGNEPKLKIDKFSDGPITCLKFSGTIDEQFDGKKLADTLKGGTLVLDLGGIAKISSFGIREWVDFVTRAGNGVDEVYLIECAPKVVDQLNMVANFTGKGRVFSFYAPYRCDYCDVDRRLLFQVDRDHEAIKAMKPPERPCETCGNPEYLNEDPTSFFSYLAGQPKFELEAGLAAFLASKLNYAVSDSARRLRAEKTVEGKFTYLKIGGDLDGSFPREKLAEGLEGTLVLDVSGVGKIDPAGAAEWRGFVATISPTCEQILLLHCPPVFVERLTSPDDLGPKAQVMSFSMAYACSKCATTASQTVDVEQHHDVLKFATPPEMKCLDCGGATTCAASETLLSGLPALPKPTVASALRKFIKEVNERKPEKPQLATTVAEAAAAGGRSPFVLVMVTAAMFAVLGAAGLVGWQYMEKQKAEAAVRQRDAVGPLKAQSAPEGRPQWIASDIRFSSYCTDEEGGGLSCVGVSAYGETIEEARGDATEAALEELANHVGLKINDPDFGQHVRTLYGDARQYALSEFEKARADSDSAKYDRARRLVREGRRNVTAAFRKSGGAAVPAQPSDEYWEEYQSLAGPGSRFLVFVRYKLGKEALKTLEARYTTPATALAAKALTVYPELAWRYPDVSEGAMIVGVGDGVLKSVGVTTQYIVLSVRDRQVRDASDFATKITEEYDGLKQTGGALKFVVKTGDGPPTVYSPPIQAEKKPEPVGPIIKVIHGGGSGKSGPTGTIWRNTGGGGGTRDNPNE